MIRIGTEKVRTGCVTCKRRRVKCDEGRPRCARCIKAGRACEGYTSIPGRPGHGEAFKFVVYTPTQGQLLSTDPDLDWSERRSLSFFQDRTALELSGSFQSDFWFSTILPLARQDPAVRHALIALSSMHEHYAGVDHFAPPSGLDFALDHYGKAIRELVRLNNQKHGEGRFDCALVTCALFSSFESLQGHYHTACKHAISGMKMLAEDQRQSHDCSDTSLGPRTMRNSRFELTRFFTAMSRQMLEIGDSNFSGPRPSIIWGAPSMPERFASYEDALLHMEVLLTRLNDYANRVDELAKAGPVPDEMANNFMFEFVSIKDHAIRWSAMFDVLNSEQQQNASQDSTPESTSSSEKPSSISGRTSTIPPAALLLQAYQSLLVGFLQRVEVNDETVLDNYASDFETCLDLCEAFLKQTSHIVTLEPIPVQPSQTPRMARPSYSLALGVVAIMFVVATRGTNMSSRERAIRLLKSCHRREGFWDSWIAGELADRIYRIQAMVNKKFGDSAQIGCKLLDVSFLPDRKCVLRYTLSKPRPLGHEHVVSPGIWVGPVSETMDENKVYYESLEWDAMRTWKS
ncbi:hypothetical protein H2204_013517 [Knufia peltigerae]|uniref:Zn(2)-C6 fungal-type domain-containing protein n=1 Tax=Knufia peltigerae TaxID=1002370 RepID=A0AA38XRD5_9EURO|nr:hypothetical protein H2204_013517 [Knufia peltigerae]